MRVTVNRRFYYIWIVAKPVNSQSCMYDNAMCKRFGQVTCNVYRYEMYFVVEGGATCLMKASSIRDEDIVACLLKHNANVNAADELDRSAVHYAFDRHIPFDGGYQGGYGYQGDYGYPSEGDANEGRFFSGQNFCLNLFELVLFELLLSTWPHIFAQVQSNLVNKNTSYKNVCTVVTYSNHFINLNQ